MLIISQISIKYQNINSQTNNILSRYFDKPQYCTLVGFFRRGILRLSSIIFNSPFECDVIQLNVRSGSRWACLFDVHGHDRLGFGMLSVETGVSKTQTSKTQTSKTQTSKTQTLQTKT